MKPICATFVVVFAFCLSIAVARADDTRVVTVPQLQAKVDAVLAKALPAVVGWKKGNGFQGSGVIVTEDGLVLTHGHHALNISESLTIVLADGRAVPASLGEFRKGSLCDYSILQIEGKGPWPHVELGEMSRVRPGAWCLHIGHPWGIKAGRGPVPRMGSIVEVADIVISSSCMIVGGDSGGPLFDEHGNLIGTCVGLHSLTTEFPADYTSVKALRQAVTEYREREAKNQIVLNTLIDRRRSMPRWQPSWEPARKATVRVFCDGRQSALGAIVDPQGLILTKRSQLGGRISCELSDGRTLEAEIAATSPSSDLALLRISAHDLSVISWAQNVSATNGTVVVVPDSSQFPIGVGIVSDARVQSRSANPGLLALQTKTTDAGLVVTSLNPGSYAADTLRNGDIITTLDGQKARALSGFSGGAGVGSRVAGDRVPIAYVRQGEAHHANVTLSPAKRSGDWERQVFSDRRSGFPSVFVHDTVITPQQCGGAVIDGFGRVIGINIARADRHETLTIPTESVMRVLQELLRDAKAPAGH
ncbi:MAG TPA: trypsin-like peptidase domain-containing protein [Planctomycetaceae bacterium]|nr:trypsin-like peptidase domain-containing protein [Planctomycetaceae bacterium]